MSLGFKYSTALNSDQFEEAANLIDKGEQLAQKLNRENFRQSPVVVVALNDKNAVVGVGA